MEPKDFPILEHDTTAEAVIEPAKVIDAGNVPDRCVLCFFPEVIEKMCVSQGGQVVATLSSIMGKHPVYEYRRSENPLCVFQPGLGAPMAAGFLDELIALGIGKFIVCGVCGVLDSQLKLGDLLVPVCAVRDEGTSYHYIPPAREIEACPQAVNAIEETLRERNCSYQLVKTWTTDAFYRETPQKVALRRREGCVTVEMEAAAFFAVSRFRNVELGQILFAGDDVSGLEWDPRRSDKRTAIHEWLFDISVDACLRL